MGMPPLLLDRYRPTELGLSSLVDATREVLRAAGCAVGDERVSNTPDARTIRYYQSLGILDRPLRHDGREAVYGYRHLLQAVATKLLQAKGYTLAQVQRALLGNTTDTLEHAVTDALEGGPCPAPTFQGTPRVSPPVAPAAPDLRALLTREVAPGVIVLVDPRLVADPDSLLAHITLALTRSNGGSR